MSWTSITGATYGFRIRGNVGRAVRYLGYAGRNAEDYDFNLEIEADEDTEEVLLWNPGTAHDAQRELAMYIEALAADGDPVSDDAVRALKPILKALTAALRDPDRKGEVLVRVH